MSRGDVVEGEVAGLLGDHRVEVDLQQQVAELLAQVLGVTGVDRLEGLVGLLEQVAGQGPVGLPAPSSAHSARSRRITSRNSRSGSPRSRGSAGTSGPGSAAAVAVGEGRGVDGVGLVGAAVGGVVAHRVGEAGVDRGDLALDQVDAERRVELDAVLGDPVLEDRLAALDLLGVRAWPSPSCSRTTSPTAACTASTYDLEDSTSITDSCTSSSRTATLCWSSATCWS